MTHNVLTRSRSSLETTLLALAIVIAGVAIGFGLSRVKSADRFVTVKGVAERDVQADLAIWPLHLIVADNDLATAQAKIQSDLGKVRAFLSRSGIDTATIVVQGY